HAVAIEVRRFGQQLFFTALTGATPDNAEWIRRKANTVQRFHRSSYAIGLDLRQKNSNLADKYGLPMSDYAAHGGSFPLNVAGAGVIGSLTVSGLPQREDHELVVEALCAHLGRDYRELALLEPASPTNP
ncbi:MAG: heme-degrading domain-containing protein, partial [Verrucomicrobia bacterium]|nr:heme-degrading domain-containing protein [Verrucomicrobiota bacterium]